ncbi:MAG TPA: tyrosine-type recombinase/integrase, partial [Rhodocyclaceae bacterium]|nr:tyrosine-type recombinase/integrase [Rhodocyclaceae bacterium]
STRGMPGSHRGRGTAKPKGKRVGAGVGRTPTVNLHLPPHMRARRRGDKVYYFLDTCQRPRREVPLGADYISAVKKWADLKGGPPPAKITVGYVIRQYLASHDFLKLKAGTQNDYRFALDKLTEHFANAPIDEVKPSHIQLYLDHRTRGSDTLRGSEHRANREIAVLGMLFRFAMARDWVTYNPVQPIKRKKMPGRKHIYTDDAVLKTVYEQADQALKDAIDLAYLIGQRPADVLSITESQLQDGMLLIRQAKTQTPVRIPVAGMLKLVIERIVRRKRTFTVQPLALLVDDKGRALTKFMLRSRFEKARAAAGPEAANFQFRDLRAKAASDLRDQAGLEAAQSLLGHSSVTMTEHYTRSRLGKVAKFVPEGKWKVSADFDDE